MCVLHEAPSCLSRDPEFVRVCVARTVEECKSAQGGGTQPGTAATLLHGVAQVREGTGGEGRAGWRCLGGGANRREHGHGKGAQLGSCAVLGRGAGAPSRRGCFLSRARAFTYDMCVCVCLASALLRRVQVSIAGVRALSLCTWAPTNRLIVAVCAQEKGRGRGWRSVRGLTCSGSSNAEQKGDSTVDRASAAAHVTASSASTPSHRVATPPWPAAD